MRDIEIEGKKYKVVDNIGFIPSTGMYAKIVQINPNGEEKVVVRYPRSKKWRFWTYADRVASLGPRELLFENFGRDGWMETYP